MLRYTIYIIFLLGSLTASAQRDTTGKQTVEITSQYKPVLRYAAKINLAATGPAVDTARPTLQYQVPAQQLFYGYQPIPLKPLAVTPDSLPKLGERNYVKAGYGNFASPYLEAAAGFGNGQTGLLNLYGQFTRAQGKLPFQEFSNMQLKAAGSHYTEQLEVQASAAVSVRQFYLFGFDTSRFNYNKSDIRQQFQDISLDATLRNRKVGDAGIQYAPRIQVYQLNNPSRVAETGAIISAPFTKSFGDKLAIRLTPSLDWTNYRSSDLDSNVKFNNTIVQLAPELIYARPNLRVHAGITPAWDNGSARVLPNIYGEAQLPGKAFLVQAGLVGRLTKNNYRNLSIQNPYLKTLAFQRNTQETELYGGIKTSVGKHFNFSARASFLQYENLPLFINDTATDNKAFVVVHETSASNFRVQADLSFIHQDKFTVTAGATFNGFTGFNENGKAWGTLPLEIQASMRWWGFKQFLFKADLRSFTGGPYLLPNNDRGALAAAADLSVGAEYRINSKFSAWLDFNNLFNNRYQRWFGYPVLGLQAQGGVIVRF